MARITSRDDDEEEGKPKPKPKPKERNKNAAAKQVTSDGADETIGLGKMEGRRGLRVGQGR